MGLTVLIVDDEPLARAGLRMFLADDPDVSDIAEAEDGPAAVAAIRATRPDLVLLDVQMPKMDGFRVVREIGVAQMPAVVFVTAHDRFAVQAFAINAIDYLLKPVTGERFAEAIQRVKARLLATATQTSTSRSASTSTEDRARQLLSLLESITDPRALVTRVALQASGRTIFVELEDVDWMQAAENYVELHVGSTSHLLHVTMNALERSLSPKLFLRIHRSLIVNIRRIREIEPTMYGESVITLTNGVRLQSGRSYRARIKALMTNPF